MFCVGRIQRFVGSLCFRCCRRRDLVSVKAGPRFEASSPPRISTITISNSGRRGPQRQRLRRLMVVSLCVLLLVLVLSLHYLVLPNAMGYYNDDCAMDQGRRERMRFVLRQVVSFLNDENATYWLDFGTLLGVMREGDIMVHDGDLDVSRRADDLAADEAMVSRFSDKVRTLNIEVTALTVKYKDVQVDMFRWQTTTSSSGTPVLRKYYPFVPRVGLAEAVSDYLFPTEVPPSVLFPLQQISVLGVWAKIPRRTLDLLKIRYPLTWCMTFPYKWKCWIGKA